MKQIGIKYGVIAGLIYVIVGLVGILTGAQATNRMLGFGLNVVMFAATFYVVYLAVKELRELNGYMTTGQGVKMGILVAFIAALISTVFNLIYFNVIDPGYWDAQFAAMEDAWIDQGLTDEQIEQASRFTKMFKNPTLTSAVGILWLTFWGLIKGAISGAILKQDPPPIIETTPAEAEA